MSNEINIGNVIRMHLKMQRRSASWLAEKLSCDRTNVYKIFKKKSLDCDLLLRISLIMEEDFFSLYSTNYASLKKKDVDKSATKCR